MKQNIEMVRGTSRTFDVYVTDANGNPYTLEEGDAVIFGLKMNRRDEDRVLIKTTTTGSDGVYTIELKPDDTASLDCGKYYYDVGLQCDDDFFNIIEISEFEIIPNATKWGDAS